MALKHTYAGETERESERVALDEAARLRPNDWSSLEVQLVDLSRTGFRARCDAKLIPGSCVSIDIPEIGQVEAQVQWQRGGDIGARFFRPIKFVEGGWKPTRNETQLAKLLVQRAEARKAGLADQERKLREKILRALPMHRGKASA